MTALVHTNQTRLAGTFTFMKGYDHPGLKDAMQAMRELKIGEWVDIHSRRASDGRIYLCFHIKLADDKKKTSMRAGHSIIGVLLKTLGHWPGKEDKPLGISKWSINDVEMVA
jgi:hypothetical protein